MIGLVLFIIAAIAVIGLSVYLIYQIVGAIKTAVKIDFLSLIKKNGLISIGFAVLFTLMMFAIYLWAGITPTTRDILSTIFGGLFFSYCGIISLQAFILHYYGKNIPENIDKWLFRGLCIAFPLTFVFVFLLSDGFADYMNVTQPLVNGINFSEGWSRPGVYGASSNIAFYAICILSGAMYVYFLSDHKMYMKYGKHGILESTLFVALPAGILGARLWYVIGNWNVEFADLPNPFLAAIDMRQGGLTILGGAIMGIGAGVAWVLITWRKKPYSLMVAMDVVVPAILIAQAVGRWGNFFNCEVHGFAMDEAYWKWLPKIIFNNAHFSSSYTTPLVGQIYVPLFLIEGIANMLGFFVISHLFGHKFKNYLEQMDLAFMYVAWYGMTRVLMEPLRDTAYNMGTDGYWSWAWSLIFVFGGILAIVVNHVARYIIKVVKKQSTAKDTYTRGIITGSIFAFIALPLIIFGIMLMSTNEFAQQLVFNNFNVGLILLITGISVFILISISVIEVLQGIKFKEEGLTKPQTN